MNRYTCDECGEWLKDDEETTCHDCLRHQRDIETHAASEPEPDEKPYQGQVVTMFAKPQPPRSSDDDS